MKPWKRPDLNLATPRAASKWPRYCAVKIPSAAPPIASLSDWSELKWRESCDWSGPCSTAGGGLLAAAWFQCWLRMQNNFGYGSQLRAGLGTPPEVFALATFALGYQLSYFSFCFSQSKHSVASVEMKTETEKFGYFPFTLFVCCSYATLVYSKHWIEIWFFI
jgi:hypothetical protein